nr:hypothetical protein BaRGS_020773 [Batillaria attramentaria]
MVWQDDRLKWNVSQYGGLRTIVTPVEDVWSPPIVIENSEIDTTTLFTPSGEFDLIATRMDHEDIPAADAGGDNFRKLHFYFTFRRKWEFYGMNLVMPIVLTSILMNAVFALPIESGEKMGFSLTVLLSYVVFLTWVTDNLPPVSSDVSVLRK